MRLWNTSSRCLVTQLTLSAHAEGLFHGAVESIIYRLRWAIESLYKQLKQNFTLHFFYGDSVNAIQIQTWVVLIANLLITVIARSIRRKCAFSQVVAMARLTLMYYIDFIAFMENPDKT